MLNLGYIRIVAGNGDTNCISFLIDFQLANTTAYLRYDVVDYVDRYAVLGQVIGAGSHGSFHLSKTNFIGLDELLFPLSQSADERSALCFSFEIVIPTEFFRYKQNTHLSSFLSVPLGTIIYYYKRWYKSI
jgi:hypothetical protein